MSDLPTHVRRAVAAIEGEPGDVELAVADIEGRTPWLLDDAPGTPGSTEVEDAVRIILRGLGEDPDRQGLERTPDRVRRMYAELTAGYHVDADRLLNGAVFDVEYSEMVVVRNIPFYSLCEHHLLPFFGTAAVAYIPRGRVVGLSKIPRIVEMFARRLQVQERLTQQVADWLQTHLAPRGVGVVVEAEHLCMTMRGVRATGTSTVTSAVHGLLRDDARSRAEFFALTTAVGPEGGDR
jgi:GTP cyclohydrolase IA